MKLPVVDGDYNADVYGHADTVSEAIEIAEKCFADEISHAEHIVGSIHLSSGETIKEAFLIVTKEHEPTVM